MSKALCWLTMRSGRRACLLKRSHLKRREGGGGERRAGLGKGVRGKRRVFSKQLRCLHNESLAWYLPNAYLPQGIWSRAPFASEREKYVLSSSLVATPHIGFEHTKLPAEGDDVLERRHVDNVEPRGRPTQDARTAAVTPSLPPSKPAAIDAVCPQEAEGDDVLERRPVDDVEPKCRRVGNVSAAVCPQRPPRTRRGTRGGRSKTKWPLTKLTLCPPT